MKILLVDDDQAFVDLLQKTLIHHGHTVSVAYRIRDARTLLERERPDLVVVDGLLPDGNGMAWIEERRQAGDTSTFLFLSAFFRDLASFRRLTRDLSVPLILHKPISPLEFMRQAAHFLEPTASAPVPQALPGTALLLPPAEFDDTIDDFAAELAGLRAEYQAKLAVRFEDLGTALAEAERDPDRHETALRLAHRLHGTAGSYGFHEVSAAAGTIETALRATPPRFAQAREMLHRMVRLGALSDPRSEAAMPGAWVATVLVIDSDPAFQVAVRHLADRALVRVFGAADAAEALALVSRSEFDGILVNLSAALENDAALLATLRGLKETTGVPIAVLADEADDGIENRIAAQHAGASLFLTRPLDYPSFTDGVRYLAALRHAARATVLAVDDDADFLQLLESMLRSAGYQAAVSAEPESILTLLADRQPDVLLLDVDMPTMSGFDVCRMLRTHSRWRELPVLFLTSRTDMESRIEAFRAGGDDLLVKPIVREELAARLDLRLERNRLLREKMEHDGLTGLLLRPPFLTALAARLHEAARKNASLAVALLDVDHFKTVNDRYGHGVGDRVLARLGASIAGRFRAEDLRARWGGEEIALAFLEQSAEMAHALLERLLAEFSRIEFHSDAGESFHVQFSAGVAAFPADGDTVELLLKRADDRLLAAKRAGRNRINSSDE